MLFFVAKIVAFYAAICYTLNRYDMCVFVHFDLRGEDVVRFSKGKYLEKNFRRTV